MWCVTRSELVKKEWKNVSRGQKRAFCSFFYWELSASFLVFPETNVVLFTNYQRYLNGQSMRQNFFQCEMPEPLLQRSLLKKWGETRDVVVKPLPVCFATEQSKVKASLFVIKNVQDRYEICQNVPWAWFHEWFLNPALYSLSFTLYFVLLIL